MDLFHHVRTCTIQDLASALTPTDFWHIHALPLGHAVEPIKFAICALGGAHKHFKSQLLGTSTGGPSLQALEELSIQQYNQAIRHIESFTHSPSKRNMEVILTCCVIFICIENLLGRYSESLRHLQAGCALLTSIRQLSIPDSLDARNGAWQDELREKSKFYDDIATMLSRLGQDVAIYMGEDIIPELYFYPAPVIEFQKTISPFDSATEAAKSLFAIETEHTARMFIAERAWKNSPEYDGRETPPYWDDDSKLPEDDKFQVLALEQAYLNWSAHFDLFKSRANEQAMPKLELHQMMMLSIGQAMWSTFLKMKSTDEELDREAWALALADQAIASFGMKEALT
ncbi:hypothetical protein G7Z17_g2162 [Cylindrodendrum hubeiense]|uniref:Uncharacterized protein n=1 Tax=Cylindrodendrum hubeiense TaxID=595255 RepID=A0A9P5HI81_9HYPO|nr:hypothetical protein G7Z17_g2162 [Cylindrodendrum hubeiense]